MNRVSVTRAFHPFLGWGTVLTDHLTRRTTLIVGDRHEQKAQERADEVNRRWEAEQLPKEE